MSETSEKLDHTLRAYGRLERKHGERGRELTAVKAERDYWRNIAQTVAPAHPVVAIPTDTLEAISARAETAEAEAWSQSAMNKSLRRQVREREAERDAYREILEEMAEWIDLMERPGPLAIVSRERIRSVWAGVVSTREKDK